MAFTFDSTLPTAKDRMRHLLGDTTSPGLRQDETYLALLSQMTEAEATATMAESIAAEYAQQPDSVSLPGGLSVSWRERVGTLFDLAARIRADVSASAVQQALITVKTHRQDDTAYLVSEYGRPHPDDFYPSPDPWFSRGDR
jgi:hypothetical protein